jgi:hypothetical protein
VFRSEDLAVERYRVAKRALGPDQVTAAVLEQGDVVEGEGDPGAVFA